MFRHPMLNFLLAILWCLLVETFTLGTFLVGWLFGAGVLWFSRRISGEHTVPLRYWLQARKALALAKLLIFFFSEMVVANVQVAWIILRPRLRVQPALMRLPIELERDLSIATLAGMISLTPGTLTVDVSEDRRTLLIHCLNVDDTEATKQFIKQRFERPLRELER